MFSSGQLKWLRWFASCEIPNVCKRFHFGFCKQSDDFLLGIFYLVFSCLVSVWLEIHSLPFSNFQNDTHRCRNAFVRRQSQCMYLLLNSMRCEENVSCLFIVFLRKKSLLTHQCLAAGNIKKMFVYMYVFDSLLWHNLPNFRFSDFIITKLFHLIKLIDVRLINSLI